MNRLYLVTSIAALTFFAYAQHQGMMLTGSRGAQQTAGKTSGFTSSGGSGRSSSLSHK